MSNKARKFEDVDAVCNNGVWRTSKVVNNVKNKLCNKTDANIANRYNEESFQVMTWTCRCLVLDEHRRATNIL